MEFNIKSKDSGSSARTGNIITEHGLIQTPAFIPVGTAGTVKGLLNRDLVEVLDASIILGNTYHLYLRPGIEIIGKAGGLHKFINWDRPVLTDSGGYQIFSLADRRNISENGVDFQSHIDGSKHFFTPEKVIDIQRIIGADIIMTLDECTPYPCTYKYAKDSMELTHRWLDRSIKRFKESKNHYQTEQMLFPIVQGSIYKDLRRKSAEKVTQADLPGNAIGGLSVGEPADDMYNMIEIVNQILPVSKPRYLMGVGTPSNILESIALGVDMFDCVMPTRNGRNGMLFTNRGVINIKNNKWKNDFSPLDPEGNCEISRQYSKAYLRHLIIAKEITGAVIASIHNLCFYLWLVNESRSRIISGEFSEWKRNMVKKLSQKL